MTMKNVSWMLFIYLFINKWKLTDTPSESVYCVDNCWWHGLKDSVWCHQDQLLLQQRPLCGLSFRFGWAQAFSGCFLGVSGILSLQHCLPETIDGFFSQAWKLRLCALLISGALAANIMGISQCQRMHLLLAQSLYFMEMTLNILFFVLLGLTFAKPGKCFCFQWRRNPAHCLAGGLGSSWSLWLSHQIDSPGLSDLPLVTPSGSLWGSWRMSS